MSPESEDDTDNARKQSQLVFLMPEKEISRNETPILCHLTHPQSEKPAMFMFSNDDRKLYEVLSFKEKYSSWIIDKTVQKDGCIFLTTPIDPLFLVIPYLIKANLSGKFMTLDQILADTDYPDCQRLCTACSCDQLKNISESKGDDDLKAYRFNADLAKSWLKTKIVKLAMKLKEKKQHVTSGAQSSIFIKSKSESAHKDDYIRYAFGIVSEYLPQSLSNEVREYLGIPEVNETTAKEPPTKKVKLENVTPEEDYSHNSDTLHKKNSKLTASQKKLEKVDKTGMKNIASFFSPKPKKS